MKNLLASQPTNDQDVATSLSFVLNKQLVESTTGPADAFVAAMFRASAYLVTSQGTCHYHVIPIFACCFHLVQLSCWLPIIYQRLQDV